MGFPTETDRDFEQTRSLLQRVRAKNNFIFKYSPRPGTQAWDRLPDDVPDTVKRQRNNDLLALQARISEGVHAEQVGRVVEVFVEGVSRKSPTGPVGAGGVELAWEQPAQRVQMSGRTSGDLIVVFDLPPAVSPGDLEGRIVPIRVHGAAALVLRGCLEAKTLPLAEHDLIPTRSDKIAQFEMSETTNFAS